MIPQYDVLAWTIVKQRKHLNMLALSKYFLISIFKTELFISRRLIWSTNDHGHPAPLIGLTCVHCPLVPSFVERFESIVPFSRIVVREVCKCDTFLSEGTHV